MNNYLLVLLVFLSSCAQSSRAPIVIKNNAVYDYKCRTDRECWHGHLCKKNLCVPEEPIK